MKSILIGLTLTFWIASYPAYTQTESSKPESYCMPLGKARLLVADALRLRVADSLGNLQAARIVLLENQKSAAYSSFTNLLNNAEKKFQAQKQITGKFEGAANSYKDERDYHWKQEKKYRRQRNGLAAGLVVVIVISLFN